MSEMLPLRAVRGDLPALAVEMMDVMGEEPTLKLIVALGGAKVVVPEPTQRKSVRFERLAEIVGADAAIAFVDRWGGIELQIPKCSNALRMLRNRRIVQSYLEGVRTNDLVERFNLTRRHIFKILKKPV